MPKLILINGRPGVGKSTLARRLTESIGVKVLGKDDIKEFLFDKVGARDREWSAMMGKIAVETLYIYAEQCLAKGEDIVIENAFWAEFAGPKLKEIIKATHASCLELYCHTDNATRSSRYRDRTFSGGRHPGHADQVSIAMLSGDDIKIYPALNIGTTIKIDTTHLDEAGYAEIAQQVLSFLNRSEERHD